MSAKVLLDSMEERNLKQRLLHQLLNVVDDHASHHFLITEVDIAARLASATGFPLLLFPGLFEERASDALAQARQRSSEYWCGC